MIQILSLRSVRSHHPRRHTGPVLAAWLIAVAAVSVLIARPDFLVDFRFSDVVSAPRFAGNIMALLSGGGAWLAAAIGFVAATGPMIISVAGGIALVAGAYGYMIGWKRVAVKTYNLEFASLPEGFDGYRIVQLSDLHIGTYRRDPRVVERIVEHVNSLDADLIVFTGDLVNNSPDEMEPFVAILSRLQSRDGVVSIMGNHDYCVYRRYESCREHVEAIHRLQDIQRDSLGWRLLLNENMTISRGDDLITLVGVENSGKGFVDHADLPRAMRGVDEKGFTVMLSHDPCHWRQEILPTTTAQLTLAGHTHAMQCRLGPISPSRLLYREWSGVYRDDNRILHVNPGTGSNVPFRLGARPEITQLTLRRCR